MAFGGIFPSCIVCFFETSFYFFFFCFVLFWFGFSLSCLGLSSSVWWSLVVGTHIRVQHKELIRSSGCVYEFGDYASLNGDLAGLFPVCTSDAGISTTGDIQQWRIFPSSSRGDRPGFPTTWKMGPGFSNIQLGKFTKSIGFPCDNHILNNSWKFPVQRPSFSAALSPWTED